MEPVARQLREAEQKIRILHQIARLVSSLLHVQHVLDAVMDLLAREFGLDACSIRLLDEEGNLRIKSHRGLSKAFIEQATRKPTIDSYSGECFLTGKILIINDSDAIDKPISTTRIVGEDIRSFALAPITVEGEAIGVLVTASREKGHFQERFNDVIDMIAAQVGIAIRTIELEQKARKLVEAERLATFGRMSQRIAHECRNSLTVIGGMARRLDKKTPDQDPRKEYTQIIVDEVRTLEKKISKIISIDASAE